MSNVVGIYACEVIEEGVDKLEERVRYITFPTHLEVFVSDHFDRTKMDDYARGVPILDDTFLAFDVEESGISITPYEQSGTLRRDGKTWLYTNEVALGHKEVHVAYCIILPESYYPKQFFRNPPHFAARIRKNIRITWYFKDRTKIMLRIQKDRKKFINFQHAYRPKFFEKYPRAEILYNETQVWLGTILSRVSP